MGCEPELTSKKTRPAKARKLDLPPGVPPLTSLYMYISGSCNLACRHCWINPTFEPDNSKGQFLRFDFVKKAVSEANSLGLLSVKLTGGEPMMHPQFREIVNFLDDERINIVIETNGTLIDEETSIYLRSKKKITFISVSIDGALAETHESLRGVIGSFDRAIEGIKHLVSAGFRPQMICTLNQGNIKEIVAVIDLAEGLGCSSIKFNIIQDIGRGEFINSDQKLDVSEIIRIYSIIENSIQKNHPIKIFIDIPPAFRSIKNLLSIKHSYCCVLNILGILSGGEVSLCGVGVSVPELVFGNISKLSIKEIWSHSEGLKNLRRLIPNHFQGICANCIHHWTCLGACIAQNYHKQKSINSSYYFCSEANDKGVFPKKRIIGENHAQHPAKKTL